MLLIDSDKLLDLVDSYKGSPMIHSIFELFYKQIVMFCTVTKCCENCGNRKNKFCQKWTCRTEMDECCEEWRMR